jgi:hypothetical protein
MYCRRLKEELGVLHILFGFYIMKDPVVAQLRIMIKVKQQ